MREEGIEIAGVVPQITRMGEVVYPEPMPLTQLLGQDICLGGTVADDEGVPHRDERLAVVPPRVPESEAIGTESDPTGFQIGLDADRENRKVAVRTSAS